MLGGAAHKNGAEQQDNEGDDGNRDGALIHSAAKLRYFPGSAPYKYGRRNSVAYLPGHSVDFVSLCSQAN